MSPIGAFYCWFSPLKKLQYHHHKIFLASSLTSIPDVVTIASITTIDNKKMSRPSSPLVRVSVNNEGMFASQRIGHGDIFSVSKEKLRASSAESEGRAVFAYCRVRAGDLETTSQSRSVSFSSEECRKQSEVFYAVKRKVDWSEYYQHCRIQVLQYACLLKRLGCMIISRVALPDYLNIRRTGCLSRDMVSKEWCTGLLDRICANAFCIELVGDSYQGQLLSATTSVEAEAAIDPNVHIVWMRDVDARLKELRNTEAGEELCASYTNLSMDHINWHSLLPTGKVRCNYSGANFCNAQHSLMPADKVRLYHSGAAFSHGAWRSDLPTDNIRLYHSGGPCNMKEKRNIRDHKRRLLVAKYELRRKLYKAFCTDVDLPNDM